MFDALDELTYDHEDDGVLVRKQLERVVIARGAWATVMFLYEELDRATGSFGAPKIAFVRLKKSRGAYRKHASFTIAGGDETRRLGAILAGWSAKMGETEERVPGDELDADASFEA
jgi:hypothetical protein